MEQPAVEQMQQTVANATPQNNQQNQQDQQNSKDSDPFEKLEKRHQLAIKLRLLGYRYDAMSELMTKASSPATVLTLRGWFMKGGICHDIYEKMQAEQMKELEADVKETEKILKLAARDAATVLREGVVSDDVSERRIANAKDVLDRTGFPKTSKIDGSTKFESDGLTIVAMGIKAILERRVPRTNGPVRPK